jgi:hypothetical protein
MHTSEKILSSFQKGKEKSCQKLNPRASSAQRKIAVVGVSDGARLAATRYQDRRQLRRQRRKR